MVVDAKNSNAVLAGHLSAPLLAAECRRTCLPRPAELGIRHALKIDVARAGELDPRIRQVIRRIGAAIIASSRSFSQRHRSARNGRFCICDRGGNGLISPRTRIEPTKNNHLYTEEHTAEL